MAMVRRFAEVGLSAWELICHASLTGALQVSCHLRLSLSGHRVPVMASPSGTQRAWRVLRSTPTDPFRVREYYRSHLISYLDVYLRRVVHTRPLVSVAVSGDRYSVGYSACLR
jgi:hypothetical protein